MSVLVIAKFTGDVAKFRQALADRGGEFAKVGEQARTAGGIHHRFGIGDGYVVVVDEWESVARFRGRSRRTGKSVAMNLHHYFRLLDGKIAYFRGTEDTAQTEAALRD